LLQFGDLKEVELSEAWPNEALDFTPWLEENIARLSEALGITLEVEGREVVSGPLRADLIARDTHADRLVLIECQLETADLHHLGQVLAYLAAFRADTAVWMAPSFAEHDCLAIRWLNENTDPRFSFFAVQVKAIRIGSSPVAALFEVLERPNEWERQVRVMGEPRSELIGLRKIRNDFWRAYAQRYPSDANISPGHINNSVVIPVANVTASLSLAQDGVGIVLNGRRGEPHGESARYAEEYRVAIEEQGISNWDSFDAYNSENWPQMIDRLHENLLSHIEVIQSLAPENGLETEHNQA